MSTLVRLAYVSRMVQPLGEPAILRLLDKARQRNRAQGITGALLDHGGRILQVLEGPADAVEAMFARIRLDPRHRGIVQVERTAAATRQFGHWAMRHVAAASAGDRMVAQFLDELSLCPDATRARQAVALLQRLADAPVPVPA